VAYPDTVVGTDSHTTMINGLGVLGWGVGGIEAEAAMLGQPISMNIPQVVGFKLTGELQEGITATDLVLTVTQMLRLHGVVGKFVEFYGPGLESLSLADRATLANMSPEYGATCTFFSVDQKTLDYLALTGRDADTVALVEAYSRQQGLWRRDDDLVNYSSSLTLELSEVVPSLAGPKRPQDRVPLTGMPEALKQQLDGEMIKQTHVGKEEYNLKDGDVVIAAITSCTNTSNPAVMMAAGLLAKKALAKGLSRKPWVKSSLAPGSKVVSSYLESAGLQDSLDALGFNLVGYGCTTCIGNSGPLPPDIEEAIDRGKLTVASVLSGNRNFEGRIHANVKMNYLASPPLVVAYAIAGNLNVDITSEPLGNDQDGKPVYLRDIWPSSHEIQQCIAANVTSEMFKEGYSSVFAGDERWQAVNSPVGEMFDWQDDSTYIRNPPYFDGMSMNVPPVQDIRGARCLAKLGDSITTDHISPAGAIAEDSPAGAYLKAKGVARADFNSYGSRRGNHEVMMRGTFANVRLRNQLAPGTEGGWTTFQPGGEQMTIFDASMRYQQDSTPLVVLAGSEYGTGSSRDWAAKGTQLLGVKAVITASFERIHRSNLIGMGVLPLNFMEGENAESLGLDGTEAFDIEGLGDGSAKLVTVTATSVDGGIKQFQAKSRLDTPKEVEYYRHGGILNFVLRQLASE
ncbi:MAG: aconitate hydratase AcnA, partial [Gammaproteobacteria bacterium]|nr:aconitate hydratase AcnA [Gammaproteobacteria bacterium]